MTLRTSALALAVFAPLALAGPAATFDGDQCSWLATDVVVVSEGATLDGKVEVLEVWRGGCTAGEELALVELAALAPAARRKVETGGVAGARREVSGQRIVLYLWRSAQGWRPAAPGGGLDVSIAWVESGRAFAVARGTTGATLADAGPEEALRARVQELGAVQEGLTKAYQVTDPFGRAQALRYFIAEPMAQSAVLMAMGACGEAALPVLRGLLMDPVLGRQVPGLAAAASRACGAAIVPTFVTILEAEACLWDVEGPRLQPGWRRGPREEVEPLRGRERLALEILAALRAAPDGRCRAAIEHLRRPWIELAARNDPNGWDPMETTCDEVLAACDRLERAPR